MQNDKRKKLTDDEREQLELIEDLAYFCDGQKIRLIELCESWLASGNAALAAIVRCLVGDIDGAITMIDQALVEPQPDSMLPLLHAFLGYLSEKNEPIKAFAEYTAALENALPREAREALLAARRRVVYVAN